MPSLRLPVRRFAWASPCCGLRLTCCALQRIFTQAIFSYLIVNKRIKCYFRENPSGYKSLTLEKSTA
jgi:hypothetical protein